MKHSRLMVASLALTLCTLVAGQSFAAVTGGVPNPNFVVPGQSVPSGNTTTNTGSTYTGVSGGAFVPNSNYVPPTTTTTTGTTNTGTGNQRNTQFLTPGEIASGSAATTGTRDKSFLQPGEVPNIPSNNSNRARNFLLPGEVPRDKYGNPLAGPAGVNNLTITKTGTRIGNCREWVNVRSGASTKDEIVGRAYKDEAISIIRWNDKGSWAYISYNGGNGWVNGSYIKK